jgi:hypothetical protein
VDCGSSVKSELLLLRFVQCTDGFAKSPGSRLFGCACAGFSSKHRPPSRELGIRRMSSTVFRRSPLLRLLLESAAAQGCRPVCHAEPRQLAAATAPAPARRAGPGLAVPHPHKPPAGLLSLADRILHACKFSGGRWTLFSTRTWRVRWNGSDGFIYFFMKFDSCNRHISSAPANLVPARWCI